MYRAGALSGPIFQLYLQLLALEYGGNPTAGNHQLAVRKLQERVGRNLTKDELSEFDNLLDKTRLLVQAKKKRPRVKKQGS